MNGMARYVLERNPTDRIWWLGSSKGHIWDIPETMVLSLGLIKPVYRTDRQHRFPYFTAYISCSSAD